MLIELILIVAFCFYMNSVINSQTVNETEKK